VYWLHSGEYPTDQVTFFNKHGKITIDIWLNRIVTIIQAYWDASGAEAAFKTNQKLFLNLSNLKKQLVECRKKIIIII